MWLVALLLILVGNCILFTLLFSNTREPLSYSQQGYLYSVALLRASSCPDVLPPSGERKIVHLRGRVSSGPSWQLLKYRRGAGLQDASGNKLSGFQRFGCVWLRLTRKFIEPEMCSGLARESSWGGPRCLTLGAIMGQGPCSCPGFVQQVLGDQDGFGKVRSFLSFKIFSISWSGRVSVKGRQQSGYFLARWRFPPWGERVGEI